MIVISTSSGLDIPLARLTPKTDALSKIDKQKLQAEVDQKLGDPLELVIRNFGAYVKRSKSEAKEFGEDATAEST